MRKTIYTNVDVEVDIDLDDFDDEELIEELEGRGYSTTTENNDNILEQSDIDTIVSLFGNPKIGSYEYFLLEKIRSLYGN